MWSYRMFFASMLVHLASQSNTNVWLDILEFVVAFLSFFGFVLTSAVILILAERKIMAYMQDRVGPVHTGPWGLLQTVADVGKLLLKEDIHAGMADKALFIL